MDFQEVMARRHSCRSFAERPVEREKLAACLEAGRLSPSGCNSQRWVFVAVDEPARCAAIAEALADKELKINLYAGGIPAYIVIVQHPPRRLTPTQETILSTLGDSFMVDVGAAAQQICLAATDLGLGSVMLGWYDQQRVRQALDIPEERGIPLIIGLGYPENDAQRKKIRYPAAEIIRWNSYTGKEGAHEKPDN